MLTLNADGSPQISVVWVAVHTTPDGDDALVTAHLAEHKKVHNIRRDKRVALTVLLTDRSGTMTPYLSIYGTARVEEGGAPELLRELAKTMIGHDAGSLRWTTRRPASSLTSRSTGSVAWGRGLTNIMRRQLRRGRCDGGSSVCSL